MSRIMYPLVSMKSNARMSALSRASQYRKNGRPYVTYWTTTAPVSNPYAVLSSFYSELAEVSIAELPIVPELLRSLV